MKKSIPNFPNYEIDYYGRVYVKKTGKELKQNKSEVGYMRVGLFNETQKNKKMAVHRLMCFTFLPNFYGKGVVDHKNRNRSDNRLWNLKWATLHENQQNRSFDKKNTSGYANIRFRSYKNRPDTSSIWRFQKRFNGKLFEKSFKTLEEAIAYRDDFLSRLDP